MIEHPEISYPIIDVQEIAACESCDWSEPWKEQDKCPKCGASVRFFLRGKVDWEHGKSNIGISW